MKWKLFYFFTLLTFTPAYFFIEQNQWVILASFLVIVNLISLTVHWKFGLLLISCSAALLAYCQLMPEFQLAKLMKANWLRTPFISWLDKHTSGVFNQYLKLFLINETTKNTLYQSAIQLNIVHLFVISGFHLSFLFGVMERWLYKRFYINKITGFVMLLLYLFLVGFAFSALRVFVSKLLRQMFPKQLPENNLGLTALLIILMSPGALHNFGFNFSFLACFVLFAINKVKLWKPLQAVLTSTLILIVVSPITLHLNRKLNALSVFHNLLFTPIALFYFCASWLLLPLIPWMGNSLVGFYWPLPWLSQWALNTTVFLNLPKPNWVFYLVYYGLWGLLYTVGTVFYYDRSLWRRYWVNSPAVKPTAQPSRL